MSMILLCIGIEVIERVFKLSSMMWAIRDVGIVLLNKIIFATENHIGY